MRVRGFDGWPEDFYQRKVAYKVTLLEPALELRNERVRAARGKADGYEQKIADSIQHFVDYNLDGGKR